jgi:hypothetical protein
MAFSPDVPAKVPALDPSSAATAAPARKPRYLTRTRDGWRFQMRLPVDWTLKVSPPVGTSFQELGTASYQDTRPAAFLEDFLRDDRPHVLAAILGNTDSGKSHLVHWMRLNLKKTDDRMILAVRKSRIDAVAARPISRSLHARGLFSPR